LAATNRRIGLKALQKPVGVRIGQGFDLLESQFSVAHYYSFGAQAGFK
jgi:hypothetical protein